METRYDDIISMKEAYEDKLFEFIRELIDENKGLYTLKVPFNCRLKGSDWDMNYQQHFNSDSITKLSYDHKNIYLHDFMGRKKPSKRYEKQFVIDMFLQIAEIENS